MIQGDAADLTEDKNITTILAKVEQEFTGPNEEYVRIQKNINKKMNEMLENIPVGAMGVSILIKKLLEHDKIV